MTVFLLWCLDVPVSARQTESDALLWVVGVPAHLQKLRPLTFYLFVT